MAEIKIEKKSSIWPWIVGLLALAVILYFVFKSDDGDNLATEQVISTDTSGNSMTQQNGDAVASYIQFIESGAAMGLDHAYTSEALTKLVSAVQAKAGQLGVDIAADMSKIADHANHITQDPFETSHADKIRSAADILSGSLQNLQQSKYPNLSGVTEEVKQAAEKINPNELTLDQKDAVKGFFEKSADLLRQMN